MIPKGAEKAIAEHFEMPPEIQRLASQATWDLHYGPQGVSLDDDGEYDYPGFTEACAIVSDWCDAELCEVWYDNQSGFVCDSEPEGYDEECDWCSGTGDDPSKADADDDADDEDCPLCGGRAERWVEPEWEDIRRFEVKDVKRALFDKELVQHI